MSTRSTTHFKWTADSDSTAIIYRHPDGYPEGHGQFLVDWLADLDENVSDPRFTDPSYLATKLVVALGREFNCTYRFVEGESAKVMNDHPLDFLSVGIVDKDPGDIEFRYEVTCDAGYGDKPMVLVYERVWETTMPTFNLLGEVNEVLASISA